MTDDPVTSPLGELYLLERELGGLLPSFAGRISCSVTPTRVAAAGATVLGCPLCPGTAAVAERLWFNRSRGTTLGA